MEKCWRRTAGNMIVNLFWIGFSVPWETGVYERREGSPPGSIRGNLVRVSKVQVWHTDSLDSDNAQDFQPLSTTFY